MWFSVPQVWRLRAPDLKTEAGIEVGLRFEIVRGDDNVVDGAGHRAS